MLLQLHFDRLKKSDRCTCPKHQHTLKKQIITICAKNIRENDVILCSPELDPQMDGGEIPAGLVTENVSVKHCVAVATFFIPPAA